MSKKYAVIVAGDRTVERAGEILAERVNEKLAAGWEVTGGVSAVVTDKMASGAPFFSMTQAVVLLG